MSHAVDQKRKVCKNNKQTVIINSPGTLSSRYHFTGTIRLHLYVCAH